MRSHEKPPSPSGTMCPSTPSRTMSRGPVGQSKLTLDQTGITLEGMIITAKAELMLQTESGAMATHKGGAMLTIKGGIVLIN